MIALFGLALSGCEGEAANDGFTGYVEARYAYVSAPQAGWLQQMSLTEGDDVEPGQVLFNLDDEQQRYMVEQALAQRDAQGARLQDLQKGARPVDLAVIEKQIQAQAAQMNFAAAEMRRWEQTAAHDFSSKSQRDTAVANYDIARAKLQELKKRLEQAKLAARSDQVAAAHYEELQAEANLKSSQWNLAQRNIASRISGTVDQIFYRQGEFVTAGTPVLSILVQDEKRVRFFVPQAQLSRVSLQQTVSISADGVPGDMSATIDYIAKDAEFTPPVIYSKEVRDKLMFLVEARLQTDALLNVGQPVDVKL